MSAALQRAALEATLEMAAGLLCDTLHDWWIIAGAAAALHGADEPPPGDVDVLIDLRDAPALFATKGLPNGRNEPYHRFRSEWLGRVITAPLPVEIMSGFEVRIGEVWHPVRPQTREPRSVGSTTIYVPSRAELSCMLRMFGRAKDIARAESLGT